MAALLRGPYIPSHSHSLHELQESGVSTISSPSHPPTCPTVKSRHSSDYASLHDVDWTFADANTRTATHGLHPYPAKFIPQIPRTLIRLLHPKDGSGILDPFCGSGTSLVESALVGLPSVGVDLNPLACLISKVKVTPLDASLLEPAITVATAARSDRSAPVPSIPRLDHWFDADVQHTLASLISRIDRIPVRSIADALRVSLASIIVRVSNQESDTRYAAVDKDNTPDTVIDAFLAAVKNTERAIHRTWSTLFPPPRTTILNSDILQVQDEHITQPISLVITSPPYPNAYEYWLYHKYRMYWLGMDPLVVRPREIGARPHYFGRQPQTAADFETQMTTVFALLYSIIDRGGHACFQVGDSVIRGEHVDNSGIISRAAHCNGFQQVACLPRSIPSTRKSFNAKYSRIRKENILVFRADK